ncbi:monosaccharide transporter [Aaosphaeria arxii CBS 175.79]|uniref:Monosaccharide transporter n=1 Tax=Aaosphaeria arxii CBS 175.79 TaxID=1450172 RepID=A0A6A5XH57_9PLEO|nr:monosaccharide transporter [Aaosphaeria arxii CBS 175.79]KAF2012422.1 monosaccharide transporter [Aaosphaeria arxii CBS 175.79]
MPSGAVSPRGPIDVERIEAPVTFKAYMMCAFAAFGGIFFGYDSGYISGVMGMAYFKHEFAGLPYPGPDASPQEIASFHIPSSKQSLIVSILSAGTFFGSLMAGDLADLFGRRTTIIAGCSLLSVGVVLQVASTAYNLLVAGRLIAGLGVGFVSAIIILYMSEIAPKKVRGMIVSGYQFCITVGILLASCVVYATQNMDNSASYRIPIAIQWVWALILALGLAFLPESPRYFVKRGNLPKARKSLARLRGQPEDSDYIEEELTEIVANHEYEMKIIGYDVGYIRSWLNCFTGSIRDPGSNLRRTLLGVSAQMMQQWTGINFIFYFGTVFFQNLGSIQNPFLISLITTLVNVLSTPISLWTIERFGRRPLLIWGAVGMIVCQFIIAIAGTIDGNNPSTVRAEIAFICLYIFFFASTWGPGCWVVVGEHFSLPMRSRGVAMSVSSNWFWNCIIAVITPYMVDKDQGNLGAKVFFVWGGLCCFCLLWAYFLVYETKGLSLEQVDLLLQETTPRKSSHWKPTTTFTSEMATKDYNSSGVQMENIDVEKLKN